MADDMRYASWRSLCEMFFERAAEFGDRPFLWARVEGAYRPLTWSGTAERVSRLSRGLRGLGIAPGERVAIVSENRPEWPIAELAVLAAKAVAVPAYITNTVDDHLHILNNSGAKAIIVSTRELAEKVLPAAHTARACRLVIALERPEISQSLGSLEIHRWDEVMARGAAMTDDVADRVAEIGRHDTAVIIHTSGTGGAPKGVMLSHGAILCNCMGAHDRFRDELSYGKEVFLSFLPLSHAYEHMGGLFFPISIGAQIYYAESVETLVANMAEARPTVMTAVPRLYEVMHGRIVRGLGQMTGLRRRLFERALALGRKRYLDPAGLSLGERVVDGLLDRLVRRKVAARFGGRLKFFISGGAPLNPDIGLFFIALGVRLLQGYGQTEAAPVISCNPPSGYRIDSVGPPLKDVEVRIAEDGEICVRGELVMQGYFGDQAATDEALPDGWLRTGDIGVIDEDGHIRITDRKKDLIVNSGGENVAPQRVEGFLTLQPEIGQAMVAGDRRPYLVAVIVPDEEFLAHWARQAGKRPEFADLAGDAELRQTIKDAVERVNHDLAPVERVRRFVVADEPFTIENGELTPSMKIRRHVIRDRYGDALDALYAERR